MKQTSAPGSAGGSDRSPDGNHDGRRGNGNADVDELTKPFFVAMDSSVTDAAGGSVGVTGASSTVLAPSSIRDYALRSPGLVRELALCAAWAACGWYSPKRVFLPLMGGVNARPIPYQKTDAGDVILDLSLSHPLIPKPDVVVPSSTLILLSIWVPLFAAVLLGYFLPSRMAHPRSSRVLDAHSGVCSVLFAVGLSELVTQLMKFYVGRLRPNFYAMCGFDHQTLSCMADAKTEMEARMSFPSGHSSLSFCGMTVLALLAMGRAGLGRTAADRQPLYRRRVLALVACSPWAAAAFVATSRLVDNWHHPSDIVAGTMLGVACGALSYHLWFPHVLSRDAGTPLSVMVTTEIGAGGKGMSRQDSVFSCGL